MVRYKWPGAPSRQTPGTFGREDPLPVRVLTPVDALDARKGYRRYGRRRGCMCARKINEILALWFGAVLGQYPGEQNSNWCVSLQQNTAGNRPFANAPNNGIVEVMSSILIGSTN